jgi:hypothetical protein
VNDFRFQSDSVFIDSLDHRKKGSRCGLPFLFENGPLGWADVLDAHPWSDTLW